MRRICMIGLVILGWSGAAYAAGAPKAVAEKGVSFTLHSSRNGNWSDIGTWKEGRLPAAGDNVQIRAGDQVVYDVSSDAAIRTIHVAGTLRFSREKSTLLNVGLIKITPGESCSEDGFACHAAGMAAVPATAPAGAPAGAADGSTALPGLEIGTAESPIPAGVKATIRLVYFEGMDKETLPAIIACGGRWDVHGAPLSRTWLKLGADAKKGDRAVTLSEAVTGWNVGDKVIVTSSNDNYGYGDTFRPTAKKPIASNTEERTITAIEGMIVTLDRALAVPHRGAGDYRAEIANLSRNVVIESADPAGVRGHTLFHSSATGGISYAEFRHLGKENVLGKYAIHFHLVRDGMRGSGVIGASVWDSHNRWITIHATDYLLVRDCVGYQSVGHGFFLEDGTEQYNILDRNLAVQAFSGKRIKSQALPFDNNEGAGFWWANGRNTLTRNVSCENDRYGFKFELRGKSAGFDPMTPLRQPDGSIKNIDIRTLPFLRFEENEAHCDGLYAMNFGDESNKNPSVHGDREHPFIVRNLKIWESHYVLRPNLQYFLLDGLDAYNGVYGVYNPDYDAHVYRHIHMNNIVSEPINRGLDDTDEQRGTFTYEDVLVENCRTGRDPIIQMSVTSPRPGQAGHFRNLTIKNCRSNSNIVDLGGGPRNKTVQNGVTYYFHDYLKAGEVTRVESVRTPGASEGAEYASIKGFTGKDVRAAQVKGVEFPTLLNPVDDLPPATMITSAVLRGGKVLVTGVTQDNGEVAEVKVNGVAARVVGMRAGVTDWSVEIDRPGDGVITAAAKDGAGNVEKMGARVVR